LSVEQHAAALPDRLGGSLVDVVIVALVGGAIYGLLPNVGGEALAAITAFAYLTLPVACFGRTAGKLVARTRVVRARDGRRPTLAQACERTALLIAAPIFLLVTLPFVAPLTNLYVFLIGVVAAGVYMSGLTRDDLAGWHDVYANTIVVRS
jgi:uncharacterized RDD family membrane protein YckC